MMRFQRDRGFTLTELLVVVSIIAMLSVLAVPKLQAAADASKQAKVQQDLQTIAEALESHFADLGYYPVKLGDLVKRGYIKPQKDLFQSPVCRCWYFYAVDNNYNEPGKLPQAYILGAPSRKSPPPNHDDNNDLHRSGPLPQGRHPFNTRARAWLYYPANGHNLVLYQPNDQTFLDPPPAALSTYRTSCQSNAAAAPCDLITN
ncbi:MAG TPA: type II secretion system protein [Symbiobacteriaceae bacterium]|jgi:prepilin-type N-terminal cleavage/methylation domain-containing protein|nr:type II secretion system protein [Symbiobacteriaceae bacterium]